MIRDIVSEINIPLVLMCDCNEWYRGKTSRILDSCTQRAIRLRTFPSGLPLFALDSIRSRGIDINVRIIKEKNIRNISDHMPIVAEGDIPVQ